MEVDAGNTLEEHFTLMIRGLSCLSGLRTEGKVKSGEADKKAVGDVRGITEIKRRP